MIACMTTRRRCGWAWVIVAALANAPGPAAAAELPGVTASVIRIGNTNAYSGPASAYSVVSKAEAAFFRMINDHGGVSGHRIDFLSYDDGYNPSRTVEQVRRLVEADDVALLFNSLGTLTNAAVERYLNRKGVPQLFVASGADRWADYHRFPWTIGYEPSYRTEARIYTRYMLRERPQAHLAILYQNDDLGRDYLAGVRDVLGARYAQTVTEVSYETTDPTVDSQLTSLRATGADALLVAATPKFAAQAIRNVHELAWRPLFFLSNVSISAAAVMQPAGLENGIGIVTGGYMKDPTDPAFKDDPGMNAWRAFMKTYMPGADLSDANYAYGFGAGTLMLQVLRQCEGDFSRANIMRQATSLHDVALPVLLPGITVNTSATNFEPVKAMQLQRWDGHAWVRFGDVIQGG